jgi:hypothetical protein
MMGELDGHILAVFFRLDPLRLGWLFEIVCDAYGPHTEVYFRKTYSRWRAGIVRPSKETVTRILEWLPVVITSEEKGELVRELRERHRTKELYRVVVHPTGWMEVVRPIILALVAKSYTADLPEASYREYVWLGDADARAARAVLAEAEGREAKNLVAALIAEMPGLLGLLGDEQGQRTIIHTISLPYGEVEMELRKDEDKRPEGLTPGRAPLFGPSARDVLESAFEGLD